MYSEMLSRPLLKVGCICIDPVPCDPHVKITKFLSTSGEGDLEDKKTEKEAKEMGSPLVVVGGVGYSEPVGENGDTENMEMEEEGVEEEGERVTKEEEEETDDYFQDPTAISKSYCDRDLLYFHL